MYTAHLDGKKQPALKCVVFEDMWSLVLVFVMIVTTVEYLQSV